MKTCTIRVKFSPPIDWLDDVPGLRVDRGGYTYRLWNEEGCVHMFGTRNTLDPEEAWATARRMARQAGYTHYRVLGPSAGVEALA